MNKLFTKIASAAMGLAMAIGVGTVIAGSVNNTIESAHAEEVTVNLSGGSHDGSKITWTAENFTVTQTRGNVTTAVNKDYISAPRVYRGHILSFEANSGYAITSVSITYTGGYFGNSMTAGIIVSDNIVEDDTSKISRQWATSTSGGTHKISSVDSNGVSAIYIQNVASTNVQLRPTGIKVTCIPASSSGGDVGGGDEGGDEGLAYTYNLVKDVSELSVGKKVVIAASDYNYALSTTQNTNNRGVEPVTKDGDLLGITENVEVFELREGSTSGSFAFYDTNGNKYLTAAGGESNNYLKTTLETIESTSSWTITILESNATIKTVDESVVSHTIRYNSTNNPNPIFSCYKSGQADVCLYVQTATEAKNIESISITNGDSLTLTEGDKATLILEILPKGYTENYTITSDKTDVVTVAGNTITAVGEGTATVTVASSATSDSIEVTVNPAAPTEVSVTDRNPNFVIGKTIAEHFTETQNIISVIYGKVKTEKVTIDDQYISLISNYGKENEEILDKNAIVTEDFGNFHVVYDHPLFDEVDVQFTGVTPYSGITFDGYDTSFNNSLEYLVSGETGTVTINYTSFWGEIELSGEGVEVDADSADSNIFTAEIVEDSSTYDETTHKGSFDVTVTALEDATGASAVYVYLFKNDIEIEYYTKLISVRAAGGAATTSVVFELGAKGSATHSDGSSASSYTETVNGVTLSITGGTQMYTGARDAAGNSCLKFGSSKANGSCQIAVPEGVTSVTFNVAKYKANASQVTINNTTYTLTKNSNDGAYDAITVDTTSTKTISFAATGSGHRAMLNSIVFISEGSSNEGNADVEAVEAFINTYMKPEVNFADHSSTKECAANFAAAQAAFLGEGENALTSATQRQIFAEDYALMFERLQAWARANGKVIEKNGDDYTIREANMRTLMKFETAVEPTLLIVIASISVISAGALIFFKKKKEK